MLSFGLILFNVVFLVGVCALTYHFNRKRASKLIVGTDSAAYDIIVKMVKNSESDGDVNEKCRIDDEQMLKATELVRLNERAVSVGVKGNVYTLDIKRKTEVA